MGRKEDVTAITMQSVREQGPSGGRESWVVVEVASERLGVW
jgi:hypothetical protein